ncbi:MAG: hypothetical protein AAF126_23405, partial [Chloroflexota bacterium]
DHRHIRVDGWLVWIRNRRIPDTVLIGYSLSSSVLGAGFFWMLTDAQAQAWHDMVADSVVVRTGEPAFFS